MRGRNNPLMRNKEKKIFFWCLDSPALSCVPVCKTEASTPLLYVLFPLPGQHPGTPHVPTSPAASWGTTILFPLPPKNRLGVLSQQTRYFLYSLETFMFHYFV